MPKIITQIADMQQYKKSLKSNDQMGFIPTMGALHAGHLSLIKESVAENEQTVVSIFVNPIQFGVNEDFTKYPRNIEKDIEILKGLKVDVVFAPQNEDIYPENFLSFVNVNKISNMYCGKVRKGHFKGVATIVLKMLNIAQADKLYLGEKDYQQIIIIEKMLADLNLNIKVVRCPIIREADGLAMSSRNMYLNKTERKNATCLYKSLLVAKDSYSKGVQSISRVKTQMVDVITKSNGIIEYIAFTDKDTLLKEKHLTENTRILLAVKFGNTRLIDNILV
ncbi:MAG: pantoate--beta-alanine ligase [Candidatus Cloacimonetes bacterium]|nr:pantoate--beta-alanine ligase [Candidatus Cloacimonadota bacterium]